MFLQNVKPNSFFPISPYNTRSFSHSSLFDLHELDIYSKQVYPRCVFLCVCVWVCVFMCVGWGLHSLFELCFYPVQESVTNTQRANYTGGKPEERRARSPWKPGGDWLHVDMLMYSGRVHVMGQWVYRPVTGHHWKTTLLTTIWCAVFMVSLWMQKWLIGCTLSHHVYAFWLVDGSRGCRSSA